jgi:hypothetical protein
MQALAATVFCQLLQSSELSHIDNIFEPSSRPEVYSSGQK